MVATKLSEVASKGYDATIGSPGRPRSNSNITTPRSDKPSNTTTSIPDAATSNTSSSIYLPSLFGTASESLSNAADQAYSTLSASLSQFPYFNVGSQSNNPNNSQNENQHPTPLSQHDSVPSETRLTSWLPSMVVNLGSQAPPATTTTSAATRQQPRESMLMFGSPFKLNNPYNRVRGRYSDQQHSSISAVRSLLPLVTNDQLHNNNNHHNNTSNLHRDNHHQPLEDITESHDSNASDQPGFLTGDSEDSKIKGKSSTDRWHSKGSSSSGGGNQHHRRDSGIYTPDSPAPGGGNFYDSNHSGQPQNRLSQLHQNSETASQLAEGTVRALRDIALDEAVEFHQALRFWSDRWEHPLLSWLEAGPTVWLSRDGYQHQLVGQKVAKIQAVLARRCAAIGELQQHLLRAGWQRGVAQWGVLGQGGQWATVQGTYVMTEETAEIAAASSSQRQQQGDDDVPSLQHHHQRTSSAFSEHYNSGMDASSRSLPVRPLERIGMARETSGNTPMNKKHDPRKQSTTGRRPNEKDKHREKGYYASVFVRNENDGKIHMDDAALAEWSVDAMALIRNLLVRASNGSIQLPYEQHWAPRQSSTLHERQDSLAGVTSESSVPEPSDDADILANDKEKTTQQLPQPPALLESSKLRSFADDDPQRHLPVWASMASKEAMTSLDLNQDDEKEQGRLTEDDHVVISNLPLMAAEVAELLNTIEDVLASRRHRRLRKLQAPSMFRRRWYVTAVAAPFVTYLLHHLIMKRTGYELVKVTWSKIYRFFEEHVKLPFIAIIEEVVAGREGMSDKKARMEVIAGLKEMIKSWLDDNHPEIPAPERRKMAERMDISLIEQQKTESMKTIFELNQAVRLSFIEMQFIKKEMVNALYSMDVMMSANDINMNLAAVTPAVLMMYTAKQVFRFFYYALLKLGKSKEETYASFRQILTDIERLLVMRDNPPSSPFPQNQQQLHYHGGGRAGDTEEASHSQLMPPDALHGGYGNSGGCDVLSADDLGMLMLHIHECRTILWNDYSRFSPGVRQSVAEDLAELAGERGAVSVQQQLQIISRMCRTYPFLKVISIGTTFHERFIGPSF